MKKREKDLNKVGERKINKTERAKEEKKGRESTTERERDACNMPHLII